MITAGSQPDQPKWVKSRYSSGNGECIEICVGHRAVTVRDSKRPDGPTLQYPADAWRSFLADTKQGQFDSLCDESCHNLIRMRDRSIRTCDASGFLVSNRW